MHISFFLVSFLGKRWWKFNLILENSTNWYKINSTIETWKNFRKRCRLASYFFKSAPGNSINYIYFHKYEKYGNTRNCQDGTMLWVIIGKYNEKKKPLTYVYLVLETASKLFFFPTKVVNLVFTCYSVSIGTSPQILILYLKTEAATRAVL